MFDNCLVWLYLHYILLVKCILYALHYQKLTNRKPNREYDTFFFRHFLLNVSYILFCDWHRQIDQCSDPWSVDNVVRGKLLRKTVSCVLYGRKPIFACTGKSHHFSKYFTQAFFVMKILWRTRTRLYFIFRTIFLIFLHVWLLFGSPI